MNETCGTQFLDKVLDEGQLVTCTGVGEGQVLGPDANVHVPADLAGERLGSEGNASTRDLGDARGGNASRQQVHGGRANERGHEARRRQAIDRGRPTALLDAAGVHDHHHVGQRHGLDLVVRHEDRRCPEPVMQAPDFDPHLHAQLRIQIGQGLVEQKGLRLAHDRPAHGNALPLASREGTRFALEEILNGKQARGFRHARGNIGLRHAAIAQAVGHVVVDAHVRVERVVLEHHGDIAIRRLDVVHQTIADTDGALRHGLQTGNHPQ
jgi:hypothetical protein